VHWRLAVVDAAGAPAGHLHPPEPLPEGDLRDVLLRGGPSSCRSAPTSGNAWARGFLDQVCPIPEDVGYYRVCADEYLYTLAPVFGIVRALDTPQGTYRIHGNNIYSARSFADKIRFELDGYGEHCRAVAAALRRAGIDVDHDAWREHSWFHRLDLALRELGHVLPDDEPFILVDDGTWGAGEIFESSRAVPFPERSGQLWGRPADDEQAIGELDRLRRRGCGHIVFAWPSFWWLDHYTGFHGHLASRFERVMANDRLVVFDLRRGREVTSP
jgi:hypothetical protein